MILKYKRWHSVILVSFTLSVIAGSFCALALAAPSKTLIRGAALIFTMDSTIGTGELGIIENADILLDRDKIAQVGKNLQESGAQVVDATGKIVMPGFVDVHNHLWQSLIRGCGTDKNLIGWLDACVFPLFNPNITLTETEAYAGVRLSTLDLINTGVTTTVDWSHAFTPQFVRGNIRALSDSGLRFVFAYLGTADPASIADMKLVKQTMIDPNPRATFQVASHPSEAFRFDLIAMSKLAKELDVKLHVHLLENIAQREDKAFHVLKEANALGPDLLGAHGIHLTDQEINILAEHDVRILHNPLSNMRLASGIIRLPELKQAGIQVGLGIDGGTNDTSDMFNDMRAALGLQRAISLQAGIFPQVADVLRMATVDGAKLLDMFDRIGSLTPGKKADLIIINPGNVNFAPSFDWVNQIVFNGQPVNVEWVFVDGQSLKRKGELVDVNPETIMEAAQKAATRIRRDLLP
ncbi:amidohydrolase family protein [Nitrosomonas communis]|uniref:5-methylthioadenosine/S-adenosylhomocysteine deaminase n=1 Tax=Nitrosomonas communis TaxID=44574 RepID=A0A1H2SIV7_9PROT|nr:amidohydrolase family protein [Nitrosomonas communis]SDW31633.1 5-methylthioadenosine/S-adenosylhomocysteine deaminase [Nitrosomonas communis]